MEQGVGTVTVVRNEVYPERVGREVLIGLKANDHEESMWRGQIDVESLSEYEDLLLLLAEPDALEMKVKVGFISRTVDWVRVDEVPVDSGQ